MSLHEINMKRTKKDPESIDLALKISSQLYSLVEDYRYLVSCILQTCNCHAGFDYQFFNKKLSDRYVKLSHLINTNKQVSFFLNEEDEISSLEPILEKISNHPRNSTEYIQRVKILNPLKQSIRCDPIDIKMEDIEDLEANEEFLNATTIPKYDLSLQGAKVAYKCSYTKCDFICFVQEDLMEHAKNHIETDLKTNDGDKRDVLYVCDQCGKEFAGQKWLENHIENVHTTNSKMYSCDQPGCMYQSKFRCVMEDHKRRHNKTKEFKCVWENCESEFVTRRDMVAHVNFYHKGIKNFSCTWPNCKASFKDSNRLRHHYFTHTGERPYKCNFPGCLSSFKQLPHLNKHKRIHGNSPANDTKTRKLSENYSEIEEKKFKSNESNDDIQALFHCYIDDCDHVFTSAEELNEHNLQHTNNIKIENI